MSISDGGPDRVHTVDALRGLAAMSVAFYHFTHGNPRFMSSGVLYTAGSFGWAGVDVFFVISGFVIPLSLARSGYGVRNFFTFVVRRIVRLDPPYLVSVILAVVLMYVTSRSPGFAGAPFELSWPRLLMHVGYLNGFFGVPWYNDVYWTLALELQFYVTMGLLFPLIAKRNHLADLAIALPGVFGLFMRNPVFLPAWIFPFLLGMLVFRFKSGLISRSVFLLEVAVAAIGVYLTLGAIPAAESLLTALAIAFVQLKSVPALEFLGAISYSLYLLHIPVGGRVVNIATRLELNSIARLGVVILAFAISIAASWVLYRMVEVPAQRLARRFDWRELPTS